MSIPVFWKQQMARLVRLPFMNWLMYLGIYLVVPRHRVGVTAVALDDQQRVLLLRHVFHPHVPWGLPGGWLNRGEDPSVGVLRELREEVGLTADLGPVLHISRDPYPTHITIAFAIHLHPGEMKLSPEIIAADWFAVDALPELFPFMRAAIETAVSMQSAQSQAVNRQNLQTEID
ncbi:MAG: NUDIX domain-containing protein [Ardenticatenaceae bacterium]|nr:NUDIX domain-containing protein [Ardenticatenaceae bacterium]